ncbi:MAG: MBL fold metallo-hydrolase [Candidatus Adiutrix sp.]|jgi:7,8-dihydropterin-6-yl-methyl-4-(beta-D-ribofuranosyl)aminobenzene 5'-phosphate synthase|nr:MBL fold metallo-hydrolase [Candidatus Adiutrix sp.]
MKITALVENQSSGELSAKHGLSLYIETPRHKMLFDLGPDKTLFDNAQKRNIDLSTIDTVIISHGHVDHGGALERFLEVNHSAKIYVQRKAFEGHFSQFLFWKVNIGLTAALQNHPQVVLLDGDYTIDEELALFTVENTAKCRSTVNDSLYNEAGRDDFAHEQSLILTEGSAKALIMGCGHTGVVNILEKAAAYNPQICVGGYHLCSPVIKKTVPEQLLGSIAGELAKYDLRYYTCHCTGQKAYKYLAERLPNMHYLSCGETIEL